MRHQDSLFQENESRLLSDKITAETGSKHVVEGTRTHNIYKMNIRLQLIY